MDQKTIYSKTGKGVLEIKNKAGKLSRDLIKVLTLIDGKSPVEDVVGKSKFSAVDIARFIKQLEDAGYIKEFNNPSSASYGAGSSDTSYVDDLDFTASLPPGKRVYQSGQVEFRQQESAARMQAEAEAKAKREEAEKRQRQDSERQAKDESAKMAKIEADRKAKEAASLKARHEGEQKAKLQAVEMTETTRNLAKVLEAERKALDAGDAKKKQEAEGKAKEDAARKAREDAERLKREAADRQRREEEERKRKETDERKRREEEEARKRREEEDRKRREEEDRKRKEDEDRKRREEEDRKRREEEDRKRREEEEARKRKEEAERKRREEEEARRRKEEEEKKRKEEEARRQREEDDRKRREEEDRRREEEDKRRREEDERRLAEDEKRRRKEEGDSGSSDVGESRRREEEDARRHDEEDARRRDEEDARRREDDDRRRREDDDRRRREDDARREEAEARERLEAAAASTAMPEINLPLDEDKNDDAGNFMAAFERQQESLKKEAFDEERKRRERDDALAAAERAERQEEARQEAERRAAEDTERQERVDREKRERKDRERKKAEEYERKIQEDEERKKRQSEEKARAEAVKIENDRRAREDDLAKKRKETEERERKNRELKALGKQGKVKSPLDRLKPVAISVVVVLVLAAAAIQFMPMSGYIPTVERIASEHIKEPVSIQSMSISAIAGFQIKLENVKIGTTQDLTLTTVTISPELGSFFGNRKSIRSIEASGGTMAREVLSRLPDWLDAGAADKNLRIGEIRIAAIKPEMREFELPPMDAQIRFGADQSIVFAKVASSDGKISAEIVPADGQFKVTIAASNWIPPIGPPLQILDLSASGIATSTSLHLTEWDARLYDGAAKGSAQVSWRDIWSVQSNYEFARIKVADLLAVFTRTARTSGSAEGKGSISLRSDKLPALFDSPGADIDFTVKRGNLDGVDLVRALQAGRNGTQGGSTKFEELSGNLALVNGRYQYRDVKLSAGILTANGSFDIAPNQEVGGRVLVELRSQAQQLRNNLNVTGTLKGIVLRP